MTEFADKLKAHNLTIAEFCRLTQTPRRTVENWYYGTVMDGKAPQWVNSWLELYAQTRKNAEKNILKKDD